MAMVSQSAGQGLVLDLVQGKAGAIRELEVAGRARSRRGKGMGTEKEVLRVIRVQVRNALTHCPGSLPWLTALAHCPGSLPWLTV